MEFSAESLKKLKGTVEKCIAELAKKDDLTPQETKALLDGFQVRDWICEEIEECKMKDELSERGYSRRMSHNGSYSMPMRGYGHYGYSDYSGYPGYPREHMNMSYCDPSDPRYYGGNSMNGNSMHGNGYSRHSIGDRIVSMMEKEMDHTESDYEKEQLHKFIRMIKAAADEG